MLKIAVDFDGTICKRNQVPRVGDFFSEEPNEFAQSALDLLKKEYDVYILTNRDPDEWLSIYKWLNDNGFPKGIRVTNIKEKDTVAYIDDRAIRFTNWLDITKYFL